MLLSLIMKHELSIILPCQNEEKALDQCLRKIKENISQNNIDAEIIVSDSSSDTSPEIAKKHNVKLVKHDKNGYGTAIMEGFDAARGEYVLVLDADGTYDIGSIPNFLMELKNGADFVIGNRFSGKMEKGAMSFSHKYIGNPILSFILRLFFGKGVKDAHCGMRAIRKIKIKELGLHSTGMEFASEMVFKAMSINMDIREVDIKYKKRIGESKLKSLSDGWRHLRFMLLYSPLFTFFIPGVLCLIVGSISMFLIYFSKFDFFGFRFSVHPMFISSIFIILGYQLVFFGIFSRTYAITHLNFGKPLNKNIYKYLNLESLSLLSIALATLGGLLFAHIYYSWRSVGYGELDQIKNSILGLTLVVLGFQTFFSSFMLSIIGIREKKN